MTTPILMKVRTHAHQLTVEQVEAQTAETARQLAEALAIAGKPVVEEAAKAGESSVAAEEPRADETAVDVVTRVVDVERPAAACDVVEEPTAS